MLSLPNPLPPFVLALLLQFAALAGVAWAGRAFALPFSAVGFAACCGLVAAGLSYRAKLPGWWLVIQGLFAPALVLALSLPIRPSFYLAGFLLLWLVYWNTCTTRVPLYLSSRKVWQALEPLLPPPAPGKPFRFADLGSGLGGVLAHLAHVRPDGVYFGVESAPLPFAWSWLRLRTGAYRRCRVRWGDFWQCDLAEFDIVFAYLSPEPMARLWSKAQTEMKPGSLFISSTFCVPGQVPAQTLQIDDLHQSTLLIWRM